MGQFWVQINSLGIEPHTAHGYVYNASARQTLLSPALAWVGYVNTYASGGDTQSIARIPYAKLNDYFDSNGVGYFIFEGVNRSNIICETYPSMCYLKVSMFNRDSSVPVATKRIYIDIQDVDYYYEHLTAGTGANGKKDVMPGPIYPIIQKHNTTKSILAGIYTPHDIKRDRVLMVHGWRMTDNEKKQFAETAFKRLYWSGYVGQFTALSWPTGWFDKPAYEYGTLVVNYAKEGENEHNYDRSEVAAREVGVKLADYLAQENVSAQYGQLHFIAHSMGNIVVSEALSHANLRWNAASYTASQAAEAAGAYNTHQHEILHKLVSATECLHLIGKELSPEDAWSCYNISVPNDLPAPNRLVDMPPDRHRFTISVVHGADSTDNGYREWLSRHPDSANQSLYKRMAGSVGRIINFHNPEDAALRAWEFNGLTRPDTCTKYDVGIAPTLCREDGPAGYHYIPEIYGSENLVRDRFYYGYQLPTDQELFWSQSDGEVSNPITDDEALILGMITPPRTKALGQVVVEKGLVQSDNNREYEFGSSNQGHSAQFYNTYSNNKIKDYWRRILERSLVLKLSDGALSGLRTSEALTDEALTNED